MCGGLPRSGSARTAKRPPDFMDNPTAPSESIAIIGMSGRFPGAASVDAFWRNLCQGVESVTFFKDEELQGSLLEKIPPRDNPHVVKARALLERPEWFDASFFGINPKEAEIIDPQHRVFLECAWEALENAACNPDAYDGLIGVFAGCNINTYLINNLLPHHQRDPLGGALQMMIAGDKDYLPMRVSYKLNLRGPSLNIQTACSTSLVTVCMACRSLLSGECDMALAGGVAISFPQRKGQLFLEGGILAPDGHCRAFDADAAGTVWGEGAGVVVLKRLSEALEDGDTICAVIRGSALNNDGAHKIGFTAPGIEGQAEVIGLAQAAAGVDPESISYVEAHGTGTPMGDPIEIAGLTKAFRRNTDARRFCAIGSVKSNIGHLDTAAGVAGLIKTVLSLQHGQIPATLHFQSPNPKIDFENSPFYVNEVLRDWKRKDGPRRAGVSSFGIGGTNAHAILEEAPPVSPSVPSSRSCQLLLLSAKTATALDAATARLAAHLKEHPDANLSDVAYTLQAGRKPFGFRRMLVCRDTAEAAEALEHPEEGRVFTSHPRDAEPTAVFMFPGQGAQHVGMGRGLYETEPVFRQELDRCCEILRPHLGLDLRGILYPEAGDEKEAARQMGQTLITQPVLFAIEYSLARLWMSWGIQPRAMIGHSLGEYVAACLSGVFTLESALALVSVRARLMQQQPFGAMLAVRLPEDEVKALLEPGLSLSAVNAPQLCVVSGTFEAIGRLEKYLEEHGLFGRRLQTSHAFHSGMMDPILEPFAEEVADVVRSAPRLPWISNVTGLWITPEQAVDPTYWAAHLRQTVRFADGLGMLGGDPKRAFIEAGPGSALGTMARQHPDIGADQAVVCSLGAAHDQIPDSEAVFSAVGWLWLAGVPVDWNGVHAHERRRRLPLPSYPFERKRFWIEPGAVELPVPSGERNGHAPVPAGDTAAPSRNGVHPAGDRKTASRLKKIFQELSGIDLSGQDTSATFLQLGFDSLFLIQATQVLQTTFGVRLTVRQLMETLNTFEKLTVHLAPHDREEETDAVRNGTGEKLLPEPDAAGETGLLPLTEAQREIWFAAQLGTEASSAYNESCSLRLTGFLDRNAMHSAIGRLAERHEALRTTFSQNGDIQRISRTAQPEVPLLDLSSHDPATRAAKVEELIETEIQREIDLVQGPLWRIHLVRLEEESHLLVVMVHHLICDGRSLGLLLYELGRLYSSGRNGFPCLLPPPERFSDHVRRQVGARETAEFAAAEKYWLAQFADTIPVLELPSDRPRSAMATHAGSHRAGTLSAEAAAGVRKLAAERGCTPFTLLLAVFGVLLHRLGGQDDIVVGIPVATQVLNGAGGLVGHCANLLPLRSRLPAGQTFGDYLEETRKILLNAFDHWQYPLSALIRKLNPVREPNRVPLAHITFNFDRLPGALYYESLAAEVINNPKRSVNFDLNFNVTESNGTLRLDCYYSSELFDAATIDRLMGQYQTLIEAVIRGGVENPVADLPLLDEEERNRILVEWNTTQAEYPRIRCVHELFEEQAWKHPDAEAVAFGGETVTYRRLNEEADALAAHLRSHGVGPEVPVGICLERSIDMIRAVLAVLKAGGAYVPLDPAYPEERLAFMLEDSRAPVLLTHRALAGKLEAGGARAAILCLDALEARPAPTPALPPVAVAHENLAYVIYTSGSTGKPKGVAMIHRPLANLITWQLRNASVGAGGRTLQFASLSFDVSFQEIFSTLCAGGTLVLVGEEARRDPQHLWRLINRERVERLFLPFVALQQLAEVFNPAVDGAAPLREIITAGEPLQITPKIAALFKVLGTCALHNQYGPSETHVVTAFTLEGPPEQWPPLPSIGRPIANTAIYLLDADLRPVPVGVAGELYVGGDCLARGYLHRPDLTAEKFVPHPFHSDPAARLYKTGDLARWLPDGNIVFLGRSDLQVKIRGHRVEPGEVETMLAGHPGIVENAVVVRDDGGTRRLVAYVVPKPGAPAGRGTWNDFLRGKLPDYMMPAAFVTLDRLPLTPSGKVDRRALPAPGPEQGETEDAAAAPRTTTEEVLADIWREVLGLQQIGIHDDFFALGGHSLLVTQAFLRVREVFHVDLPLRRFFEATTIAVLAAVIEEALIQEIQMIPDESMEQRLAPLAGKETA
jgi:amino acid adenylation domain-containing protein